LVVAAENAVDINGAKSLDSVILPIDDILAPKVARIVKKYNDCLSHEHLKPLSDLFRWELDALYGLIFCLNHLNHWRFFESLIQVNSQLIQNSL
jgi:hypothetical protein